MLEIPLSQIVQSAVTDIAHALGFSLRSATGPSARPTLPWPDLPDREEESAAERLCVTLDPLTSELLRRAAQYVQVGETMFILGATFRYLADLKTANPEDRTLQRLIVPKKYERTT